MSTAVQAATATAASSVQPTTATQPQASDDKSLVNRAASTALQSLVAAQSPSEDADEKKFDSAKTDFDKRNAAMDIVGKHKNMLDKASNPDSDGTDSSDLTDGHFNTRDFFNLAGSEKAPAGVVKATKYISEHAELLRDIDGKLTKQKGDYSNGAFSWDDFDRAKKDFQNPDFKATSYDKDVQAPFDGSVGVSWKQAAEGNCGALVSADAVFNTDAGKALLRDTIKVREDGSFDVKFRGGDGTTVNVQDPGSKFAGGDKTMQVLNTALDGYQTSHGHSSISKGDDAARYLELFTGTKASSVLTQNAYRGANKPTIKESDFREALEKGAEDVNHGDRAMVLASFVDTKTGNIDAKGNSGGGHGFTVDHIDTKNRDVAYTNPWDPTKVKHINLDTLANQLSKTQYVQAIEWVDLKGAGSLGTSLPIK